MAYNELIKNFNRVRDYMREFYVYGFKSRDEYTGKSARSYDNERRRLESWLGDYMQFRQTPEGKNVFLSIDSRYSRSNPLYKAWKAKSFTDGDITLHFILFDILSSPEICLTLREITNKIDDYLLAFSKPRMFDESTVRKKLKEYISEGIIFSEKRGKTMYYCRSDFSFSCDSDILNFFSEVSPCGVVGSYLMDKADVHQENFVFKHHYITNVMDSEIIYSLLNAMSEKRQITLKTVNCYKERITENHVVPLRIMVSVQNGRQYLMAYVPGHKQITPFRVDNIESVKIDDVCTRFDELREELDGMQQYMWGVSTRSKPGESLDHVEFTVRYADDEIHIHERLEREKRCGFVERIDENTSRFSADVFDTNEMIPWIRTFICRITDINFSNKEIEAQFKNDIKEMYVIYGLEDGDSG
ncbi:MAG: WYL domain-containing protein [Saccharofermentanales bacterium]